MSKDTLAHIISFTNILFGVLISFILIKSLEIGKSVEAAKLITATDIAKSWSLYIFLVLYMSNFWLATVIEIGILGKYRVFPISEYFLGSIFGVAFVLVGYWVIQLTISCRFTTVFLLFVVLNAFVALSGCVEYAKGRYTKKELADFYASKEYLLHPVIRLVVIYAIYCTAMKGFIGFAIGSVWVMTLISEIVLYRFRIRTIYKLTLD